ncbi:HU family DNA-binding protein [Galactobacillus timonensis]|uniref:HU family DNA-binding protein n=1 Tax=Galactobacillus timonensis TaxID=2041840 RepID=UPI000C81C217|nr:HU family DNA-binding protein [Galactobacillus timonensis]
MVNTICNKSVKDLVNRVCAETGLSRKKAQEAVAAVFAEISDILEENGAVNVPGFGKFENTERKERTGINPATREKILIPAAKTPRFKPSSKLKEKIK